MRHNVGKHRQLVVCPLYRFCIRQHFFWHLKRKITKFLAWTVTVTYYFFPDIKSVIFCPSSWASWKHLTKFSRESSFELSRFWFLPNWSHFILIVSSIHLPQLPEASKFYSIDFESRAFSLHFQPAGWCTDWTVFEFLGLRWRLHCRCSLCDDYLSRLLSVSSHRWDTNSKI